MTDYKSSYKIIATAMLLVCMGCSEKSSEQVSEKRIDYTWESLPAVDIDSLYAVDVDMNSIGMAAGLVMVDDNTIAVLDNRGENQVKIIDLANDTVYEFIHRGNGPDEMAYAASLSVVDDSVWVGGTFDNKIACVARGANGYDSKVVTRLEEPFIRVLPLKDGSIITVPATMDTVRFVHRDVVTGVSDSTFVFPVCDEHANNALFQGELALSPNGEHVVALSRSWGIVEVFDSKTMSRRSITQGPVKIDSKIEMQESPYGTRFMQTPMYIVLVGLSTGDDGFISGFVGANSDDPASMAKGITRLIKYDYDGMPQRYYNLPEEIRSFTTTTDSKTFYGVMHDENGGFKLVRAQLK